MVLPCPTLVPPEVFGLSRRRNKRRFVAALPCDVKLVELALCNGKLITCLCLIKQGRTASRPHYAFCGVGITGRLDEDCLLFLPSVLLNLLNPGFRVITGFSLEFVCVSGH